MPFETLVKKGHTAYNEIMYCVYILQSINAPNQTYIGIALDLKARIQKHNEGGNKHTTKFKPWKLIWFCAFPIKAKAAAFEQYLKTASGIAFRRKRLIYKNHRSRGAGWGGVGKIRESHD